jgi:transcriptional regulator with XRE-family HTH domain
VTEIPDYREQFAHRVRSLREVANLSIEQASERGGLSPTFWGNVERTAQEPCLNTIFAFAVGLGISASTLLASESQDSQDDLRDEVKKLLDLFTRDQLGLALDILKSIYNYKRYAEPGLAPSPR